MNAFVGWRQLSPRLAIALLMLGSLAAIPPASAATDVQAVSLATDRIDYVNASGFNQVTATATVNFNGAGPLDPVMFEWFAPGGPSPFRTMEVPPSQIATLTATASDSWVVAGEGSGFSILASINQTVGNNMLRVTSPPATINVYNRTGLAIVMDVAVTTSPVYENGTVATARADLKYAFNASHLLGVQFDWFYPDGRPAYSVVDSSPVPLSNASARASSSWTIDRIGRAFHVNATYLGGPPITNTTSFDVLEHRIGNWVPASPWVGRRTLDLASSPWGVCSNATVPQGAELFIEAGVEIRFCPGTGLSVSGTLTVDALPTRKAYFLSLPPLGEPMRAGDWRGITFFPDAAPDASILSNVVIQGVTDGVAVQGTAVTIVNSTIALATGAAIHLSNSASLVGNNEITQSDVGILVQRSDGPTIDSNRIQGARVGILVEDSVAGLAGNDVSLSTEAGMKAVRSRVVVDGGVFRDNGDVAVFLTGVQSAYLLGLTITGGTNSLRGDNSRNVVVELSTLSGARDWSVRLINVTATFINTTLAATQYDLVLIASPTTLVNSTYGRLYPPLGSALTIKNFLHAVVESDIVGRPRIAGAWVNVSSDNVVVASRRTDAAGVTRWILLTDRIVFPGRVRTMTNSIDVRYDGYLVEASPRTVSMVTSHTERFSVIPLTSNPGGPSCGVHPMILVFLLVVMGTVLLAMPAMRRRRASTGPPLPRAVADVVLEPGKAYLLSDEKSDRAFQIFASKLSKGAKGLAITRIYPDEARHRYRLRGASIVWLSRGYGRERIRPTNLGALVQEVERFVSGTKDTVVLLDGLEYLLVQNDPQKVVKFVQTLSDTASVHRTRILIPFNVKTVDEPLRALITRDLQPL